MTRKDYELIARVLASHLGRTVTFDELITGLADAFQADNPRFDRTKFYGYATGIIS